MGVGLSIETYSAQAHGNKKEYRISLDAFTSSKHRHVRIYQGMRFYRKMQDKMIIAKFPTTSTSGRWAEKQVQISREVSDIADKFNAVLRDVQLRGGQYIGEIRFPAIILAKVDEVAFFSRKRQIGQHYTFESKLNNFKHFIDSNGVLVTRSNLRRSFTRKRSSLRERSTSTSSNASCGSSVGSREENHESGQTYMNPPPYVSSSPPSYEQSQAEAEMILRRYCSEYSFDFLQEFISYPEFSFPSRETTPRIWESAPVMATPATELYLSTCSPSSADTTRQDVDSPLKEHILEAFIHYFFSQTNGQCAVCNLKGSVDRNSQYKLTTPVFHSLTKSYGYRDQGEKGISRVIKNHRCNSLCCNFTSMNVLLEAAKTNNSFC